MASLFAAGVFAISGTAQKSQAQNLVITNARIIVGNGQVIEQGGILVRDGRIAAVVSGEAPTAPPGTQTIDASGFTVMPGFIDDHRHLIGRAENFFGARANKGDGDGASGVGRHYSAGYPEAILYRRLFN